MTSSTHPLTFGAHGIPEHVDPVGHPCRGQDGRFPVDLQDSWGWSTQDVNLLGRQGRSWQTQVRVRVRVRVQFRSTCLPTDVFLKDLPELQIQIPLIWRR